MMELATVLLVDQNGDGIPDDLRGRLTLPPGEVNQDTIVRAIDLAAQLGLRAEALPFPVCVVADDAGTDDVDLTSIAAIDASATATSADAAPSPDLLDLFTIDGALADTDDDLLPDATRISFDLPDSLPAELAAAVINVAARVGLETGGLGGSLTQPGGAPFRVQPSDGAARLNAADGGWTASGDPTQLAELLNLIASDWPYAGHPASGGLTTALRDARRKLVGCAAPSEVGDLAWEAEWSADHEVANLYDIFDNDVVAAIDLNQPVRIVALVSEPPEERQKIAQSLHDRLDQAGANVEELSVISAYKIGLSWLREVVLPEATSMSVARLDVQFPRHNGPEDGLDMPIRWLQELFPGDEIAAQQLGLDLSQITFTEESDPDPNLRYEARAFDSDGEIIGSWDCPILSSGQWTFVPPFEDEGTVCITTGGVVLYQGATEQRWLVETDLERFWHYWQGEILPKLIDHIESVGGPTIANQPFFGRLDVEVTISEPNQPVGIREENDSAAEALHEDIYFNALDFIQVYGEHETGESTSAPGAVVPVVRVVPGAAPSATFRLWKAQEQPPQLDVTFQVDQLSVRDGVLYPSVAVEADDEALCIERLDTIAADQSTGRSASVEFVIGSERRTLNVPLPEILASDEEPRTAPSMNVNLHGNAVMAEAQALTGFPGVTAWVESDSTAGRPMLAIALTSATAGRLAPPIKASILKPTGMITARHHANEISSTNSALALAWKYATDPEWREIAQRVNVVMLPYENPDGAALHAQLSADPDTADWKHHIARYNLHGTEFSQHFFDPNTPFGEALARPNVWRRWLPDALVDNHGVPSHEWTQPFSGFGSPPRFRISYWVPQALIYGIAWTLDDPNHIYAADRLVEHVCRAYHGTRIGELNEEIWSSYKRWGQDRLPERFPGDFVNGMLWHRSTVDANSPRRGFSVAYPRTTYLSWVTEVNDETAIGTHLETVAEAHLLANKAMLELLIGGIAPEGESGQPARSIGRDRPLRDQILEERS